MNVSSLAKMGPLGFRTASNRFVGGIGITMIKNCSFNGNRIGSEFVRHSSFKSKWKSVSASIDKVGDENTRESQVTLKVVRWVGVVSIVTVLCSLFWASSMVEPKYEPVEMSDLKKDVRD